MGVYSTNPIRAYEVLRVYIGFKGTSFCVRVVGIGFEESRFWKEDSILCGGKAKP